MWDPTVKYLMAIVFRRVVVARTLKQCEHEAISFFGLGFFLVIMLYETEVVCHSHVHDFWFVFPKLNSHPLRHKIRVEIFAA